MFTTLVLAHAGEDATWQALLTLLSIGLVVVFLLTLLGKLQFERPDDLVLPLAGVAILASLSGAVSNTLSDWVGWAFPIGVTLLVALVLAALTPLEIKPLAPLGVGAIAVAVVAAVALHAPIARTWHPVTFASTESVAAIILSPDDGATVTTGEVDLQVAVRGNWRIGVPNASGERLGLIRVFVNGFEVEGVSPAERCATGCTEATYPITLDEPGDHRVQAEFVALDGTQFVSTTFDSITLSVEAG